MFVANKNAKRPSASVYVLLKSAYEAIGFLERAVSACQRAVRLKGDDPALVAELKRLAVRLDAAKGGGAAKKPAKGPALDRARPQRNRVQADNTPQAEPVEETESVGSETGLNLDVGGDLAAARTFFAKARKAAEGKNYDYAIEMYLDGLRRAPDALEEGHLPLCELGLQRRGKGGKKPTMVERVKRLRGKNPLEQMLNAEYLFAKDPDHTPYAEAMLKAAVEGGYHKTAHWMANLIFQTNNAVEKPSLQTYILLKDSYTAMGQYDKAVAACQRAVRMRPDDKDLADDFKNLSAELTMSKGKYGAEGDFRQSIQDREEQAKLYAQDRVIKTKDYRVTAVEDARKAYAADPDSPRNAFALADALADLDKEDSANEAIAFLESTAERLQDFRFHERAGQLRIRQIKRQMKPVKKRLKGQPDDDQAQKDLEKLEGTLRQMELEHYRLCMENYPTDLAAKYEYAVRLMGDEQYNEAIPLFQEAQKDPRRKISAMDKIGYCFFKKGWYADAVDVFARAIEAYEIKDDATAKELRYNLARAYEEQDDQEKALELYRRIAQLDFGYRDVCDRVDRLRAAQQDGSAESNGGDA